MFRKHFKNYTCRSYPTNTFGDNKIMTIRAFKTTSSTATHVVQAIPTFVYRRHTAEK